MRASDQREPGVGSTPTGRGPVRGRCGSLEIRAAEMERLASTLGRPLRIAYCPGFYRSVAGYRAWLEGRVDPDFPSIAYPTQFFDLVDALGAEALIVSFGDEPDFTDERVRCFSLARDHARDSKAASRGALLGRSRRIRKAINAFEADVSIMAVHVNWTALRGLEGRKIFSMHTNLWHPDQQGPRLGDIPRLADQWLAALCVIDASVAVSALGAEQMRKLTGGRLAPLVSVPQSPGDTVAPIAPPPAVPRILFVGRVDAAKGVFDLLSAAKALRERRGPLELVFLGSGPAADPLAQLIATEGLGAWVRLLPRQQADGVFKAMDEATLLCCPTRRGHVEGQPRVIAEAHMAGRPSVASDICRSVADRATLHYPAENTDALSAALERALFDGQTSGRLLAAAAEGREIYADRRQSWGSQMFRALQTAFGQD